MSLIPVSSLLVISVTNESRDEYPADEKIIRVGPRREVFEEYVALCAGDGVPGYQYIVQRSVRQDECGTGWV
jgi:hypothetical protein